MIHVQGDHIPAELKALDRWVCWQLGKADPDTGKRPKVPISTKTGRKTDACDPDKWVAFERAYQYYSRNQDRVHGIGFVFARDKPLSGIDLDKCRDPETREVESWASEIIRDMASYTEISPSGTGVKIFVRGQLPSGARCREGSIEMYSDKKYFTVTGAHLSGTPTTIEERQEKLVLLHSQVTNQPRKVVDLPDADIVANAKRAANGEQFARLWSGDISGYRSESEADLALCNILVFWTGPDPQRVEALFNQSELGKRKKWIRREDYRQMTIHKAIGGQTEFFHSGDSSDRMLTRRKQKNQDKPRFQSTGDAGRQEALLSPAHLEQGVDMAIDLAQNNGDVPNWQASFLLARRLRCLTENNPEQFDKVVAVFCKQTHRPFEAFWLDFLVCWPKVKSAEGDDALTWALNMAKKEPYIPTPNLAPLYATVASIARQLSQLSRCQVFWLPCEKLAKLLNTTPMQISRVVTLLQRYGVVRCVDPDYSFTKKKAKEYIFTGDVPLGNLPPSRPSSGDVNQSNQENTEEPR